MMNSTEERIHRALRQLSFLSDLHVVGGAVRDAIIGRDSDDIDLATSDRPETVKQKAQKRNWNVVETGIGHGTVTLLKNDLEYEVTTFRRDVSTDGRNATVEFADTVEDDLSRRDFTINAMAARLSGEDLEVIDPYGGRSDIEDKRIRTVGSADRRFREDFLRIVRALRFAARYDFLIDYEEVDAMRRLSGRVSENVSVERVMMEIEKAMKDDQPAQFLTGITDLGILSDLIERKIWKLETRVHKVSDPKDRMILFIDELSGSVGMDIEEVQQKLKLSNDLVEKVKNVGTAIFLLRNPVRETIRRKILAAYREHLETAQRIGNQIGIPSSRFAKPEDVPLEPIVTGQDFLEEGFEEGPQIGDLVQKAHDIQLEEAITDRDTLIQRSQNR